MNRWVVLMLVIALLCGVVAADSLAETSGMYTYTVKADGTAEITAVDKKIKDGNIPAELDGYKVTSIGQNAFADCRALRDVVIPDGVTYLGNFAFNYCPNLRSVSIPDSLTDMEYDAINNTPGLEKILVSPEHPVYVFNNRALINKEEMSLLKFAGTKGGDCEVIWGIRTISAQAFHNARVTSVTLPGSVERIEARAFAYCEKMKEIYIPNSVRFIASDAFEGCRKIVCKGQEGSYAQKYCEENGIKFVAE